MVDFEKWSVVRLKEYLRKNKQLISGRKCELITRAKGTHELFASGDFAADRREGETRSDEGMCSTALDLDEYTGLIMLSSVQFFPSPSLQITIRG